MNDSKSILIDEVKQDILLRDYTTFRIGGAARYFLLANSAEDIIEALGFAKKKKVKYYILGGGSNVLVSDAGFDGLVIKISNNYSKFRDNIMECGAGLALSKAMSESLAAGLVGLEWAAGIPGTVGGAIHGNAGAYGGDMGRNTGSVGVIRGGKIKKIANQECGFSYRSSAFNLAGNNDIIVSADLQLKKGTEEEIISAREKIKRIIKERGQKFSGFSAGSVFKNIILSGLEMQEFKAKFPQLPQEFAEYKKIPSAWLIDQCGLKGKAIGGARISDNHAGIIVNSGSATAEDVIMLISIVKQKVRSGFNLELMEEIEYVGF